MHRKDARLVKLHGIGAEFATVLTREVFYRPFQNRRQVASYVGLTPALYDSGDTKHDQGINKAGNTRARVIAVQMAWLWLRYQSKSICPSGITSESETSRVGSDAS